MQEVGVITLYNALNYGAFLQAYALEKVISNLGYNVEFIDSSNLDDRKLWIKTQVFSKRPSTFYFNLKKSREFSLDKKKFNISKVNYIKNKKQYYAVIIGSDEMWNICNNTFLNKDIYYGSGIKSKKISTYAVSCGNAYSEDLNNYSDFVKGIKNIEYFSARDINTKLIMEEASKKKVEYVLDPTLLYDFKKNEGAKIYNKKYILIYTYGFNENQINKIKEYSSSKNFELISLGFNHKWCDKRVSCGPLEFLKWIEGAENVITDTFHGTLFSIIYKKNFVVLGKNKIKINDALEQFNLTDRIAKDVSNIHIILDTIIDYDKVYSIINDKRKMSIAYLKKVLSND